MNRDTFIKIGILLVGILLGCIFNCSGDKDKDTIKTTTSIKYVIKKDTIVNEKPILVYKNKDILKIQTNTDTIIKDFNINDYIYTYTKNDTLGDVYIKGWGSIDSLSIINKHKDKIITNNIKETIYKSSNGLFLSGEYLTPLDKNSSLQPIYKANIDYIIRNKVIIGGSIGIQGKDPYVGLKLGLKI